jgi:hypothetical protein
MEEERGRVSRRAQAVMLPLLLLLQEMGAGKRGASGERTKTMGKGPTTTAGGARKEKVGSL